MSNKFKYVIDLVRHDVPEGSLSQTIVWPFYYWSAVVPAQVTEDTPNIFEQLYMSIKKVSKEIGPEEIFNRLRIDKELYKSVEKSCEEDGFDMDELKITNDNLASIKIFKDAVAGKLIPELTIENLPKEYKIWDVEYIPTYDSSNRKEPDAYEIERMLHHFKVNKRRLMEETVLDDIDVSEEDNEPWDDEEGDWNQESTKLSEEKVVTMADAEEDKIASMVQIQDSYPELVWVRTKIYLDPINPDIVHMMSPFKNVPQGFFDKILAFAAKDKDFHDSLEYFKADVLDKVKDSVALNNDLNIPILDRYPILSNYEQYAGIKLRIKELYRAKIAITEEKGDAYDNYFSRCGKLLETMFQYVIYGIRKDERKKIKKIIYPSAFSYQLTEILESLGQEDVSQVSHFAVKQVYACLERKSITPKSAIIVLALYAAKVNLEKKAFFQKNIKIVSDIYKIYNIRNQYNHSSVSEDTDGTDPYIILESTYDTMMDIIGAITENFLKVEN